MTRTPLAFIQKGRTNLWKIPVGKTCLQPGFNARGIDYGADPEEVALLDPLLDSLALSIAEHGIRLPCTGSMVDGKFRLTDGHRRTCGLRLALARGLLKKNDPRALVPVLPEPARHAEDARILDMLVLNSGKPLELLEQADAILRLIDEHQHVEQDVATRTGFSITHIRNCVLLRRKGCPALLAAIGRGEIAATTAIELIREIGDDPEAQLAALEQARAHSTNGKIRPKDVTVGGTTLSARRSKVDEAASDEGSHFQPPTSDFQGAEPDTAVTNDRGEFISGWTEHSVETPHPKVRITILFVQESAIPNLNGAILPQHYYGLTLKWPGQRKGDGFLHEKPQRQPAFPTHESALLAALQRIHGEMGAHEFKGSAAVLTALEEHIARAAGPPPETRYVDTANATLTFEPDPLALWSIEWAGSKGQSGCHQQAGFREAVTRLRELWDQPGLKEIVLTR